MLSPSQQRESGRWSDGISNSSSTRRTESGSILSSDESNRNPILLSGGCPPGVLHVQVIRGHKLRETQRLMRQDPFVTLQCSGMRKHVRTKYIRSGGLAPVWTKEDNSMFALPIQGSSDVFKYPEMCHIEVWNENTLVNSLIGTASIDVMPFIRQPDRTAWHWQQIVGGDGKGDCGRMLFSIKFEHLKKNRIVNSEGVSLRKIGNLHVGLPQTKLHLLLPKAKTSSGASKVSAADVDDDTSEHSTGVVANGNEEKRSSSTSSSSSTSTSSTSKKTNPTMRAKNIVPNANEHRYAVRIHVEGYELSTEPIVVGDMEADGTLSFTSWELNRDGRQRLSLPLAITNPFAEIQVDIVTIAPDTQEERIMGTASTSILRLVE